MILIFGGAHQGKLDFAKAAFSLSGADVFRCSGGEIDFSFRCITDLEEFTRGCSDPVGYFAAHRAQWRDSVLILQDMFCGVVPIDPEVRRWRQDTALLCQYLSREAGAVYRIFLGIPQKLK